MKSTGSSTEPCGTLQVTGRPIGPDITPLHRRSESGQTSKMKTNPLQTLERQNADQGQLAVWSDRQYQMPNLNPVG